ncbi:hypothetical protein [Hymenobacter psoromatis]|uniref:hypothetical protein n=1 Tax=Hymenobacter psoromatis TaxID=1484116 RepID=UPI001CBCFB36|nr:hypothetical protein [Hymenobacter psoromatis]
MTLLRLAGCLRWAGATRAAAVARSLTLSGATRTAEVVKNATWASAAEETFGVQASLKQYGSLPWKESVIATRNRFGLDFAGQGIANYYGSKEEDRWARVWDAGISVNLVESVLAGFNVRPLGLGTTSAMFQFSVKSGFRTPLNGSVSWQAFGVQTAAGVGMGYAGIGVGNLLSKRLAYRLYNGAALRLGYDMAYPVWLGSAHLFRTVIPIGLGGATTIGQNKADEFWPASPQSVLPVPGSSKP